MSACRDAFQFYVAQDAHFLEAFSSAYQAAVKKAAHAGDSDAGEVLKTLLHGVAEELQMHASYAKVPVSPLLHQVVSRVTYIAEGGPLDSCCPCMNRSNLRSPV